MLPTQTFQPIDLGVVLFLVLLEALLSADNALVLAIMVRHLPKADRKRALFYGLGGALVFRFVAILLARQVLALWWLQALGAAYLLFIPAKHFLSKHRKSESVKPGAAFWPTVIAVELSDFAFAIDSVLAGVGVIRSAAKIWVVFVGAAIGIVLLRFAANLFIKLLAKYPILDDVAYLLVAWVGVKLCFTSAHNAGVSGIEDMTDLVFWSGMFLIGLIGTLMALKKCHPEAVPVLLSNDEPE